MKEVQGSVHSFANACKNMNLDCIGSEISEAQCDYAKKRIDDMFCTCEVVKS